jgi:hypothetical protein
VNLNFKTVLKKRFSALPYRLSNHDQTYRDIPVYRYTPSERGENLDNHDVFLSQNETSMSYIKTLVADVFSQNMPSLLRFKHPTFPSLYQNRKQLMRVVIHVHLLTVT